MKGTREYHIEKAPEKELRDETISKYKDFGKFTANYQQTLKRLHKKPLYKDPKAFITLVLVVVVALLVWLAVEEESGVEDSRENNEDATTEVTQ